MSTASPFVPSFVVASADDAPMIVTLSERWLQASFRAPVRACSWAIVGGGITVVDHVAWCEVRDVDLRPPVDARQYLQDRLEARGLGRAVGLLTSRRVATYSDATVEDHGLRARCLATVGLGNALRAGDPAGVAGRIGTINILVHLDAPLSDEALLEASGIATEAKAAAVLDAGVRSRRSGRGATGTGTDCTVVACDVSAAAERGLSAPLVSALPYAGKHTTAGSLVGAAVEKAVSHGVARWLAENAP